MLMRKFYGKGDSQHDWKFIPLIVAILCVLLWGVETADDVCEQQALTSFHLFKIGKSGSTNKCRDLCCKEKGCDVALKVTGNCYGIKCVRGEVCDAIFDELAESNDKKINKRNSESQSYSDLLMDNVNDFTWQNTKNYTEEVSKNLIPTGYNHEFDFPAYLLHNLSEESLEISDSNPGNDGAEVVLNNESISTQDLQRNTKWTPVSLHNKSTIRDSIGGDILQRRERSSYDEDNEVDDDNEACSNVDFIDGAIKKRKKSYKYKKISKKSSWMSACSKKCCDMEHCIMSFLVDHSCYAVLCQGEGDCRDKKDSLPSLDMEIARAKRDRASKNKRNKSKKKDKISHHKSESSDDETPIEVIEIKEEKKVSKPKEKRGKKSNKKSPKKQKTASKKDEIAKTADENVKDVSSGQQGSSDEYHDDIKKLLGDRIQISSLFDDATIGKTDATSKKDHKKKASHPTKKPPTTKKPEHPAKTSSIPLLDDSVAEGFTQITNKKDSSKGKVRKDVGKRTKSHKDALNEMSGDGSGDEENASGSGSMHPHRKYPKIKPISSTKKSHVNELLKLLKSKREKKSTSKNSEIKEEKHASSGDSSDDILLKKIEMLESKIDAKKKTSDEDVKKEKILKKISEIEKHLDDADTPKPTTAKKETDAKKKSQPKHVDDEESGDGDKIVTEQHKRKGKVDSSSKHVKDESGERKSSKKSKESSKGASKKGKAENAQKKDEISGSEKKHEGNKKKNAKNKKDTKVDKVNEKRMKLEEELMKLNQVSSKENEKKKDKAKKQQIEDFDFSELKKSKEHSEEEVLEEHLGSGNEHSRKETIESDHTTHHSASKKKEKKAENAKKQAEDKHKQQKMKLGKVHGEDHDGPDEHHEKATRRTKDKKDDDDGSGIDEWELMKEFENLRKLDKGRNKKERQRFEKDFIMRPNKDDLEKYKEYALHRTATKKKLKEEKAVSRGLSKVTKKKKMEHSGTKKNHKTKEELYKEEIEKAFREREGSGDEKGSGIKEYKASKHENFVKKKSNKKHSVATIALKKSTIKHPSGKKHKVPEDDEESSGSGEEDLLKKLIREKIEEKLGKKHHEKKKKKQAKSAKKAKTETKKKSSPKKKVPSDAQKRTEDTLQANKTKSEPKRIANVTTSTPVVNNVTTNDGHAAVASSNGSVVHALVISPNVTKMTNTSSATVTGEQNHKPLIEPNKNVTQMSNQNSNVVVHPTKRPKTPSRPKMTTVHIDGDPVKLATPTTKPTTPTTVRMENHKDVGNRSNHVITILNNNKISGVNPSPGNQTKNHQSFVKPTIKGNSSLLHKFDVHDQAATTTAKTTQKTTTSAPVKTTPRKYNVKPSTKHVAHLKKVKTTKPAKQPSPKTKLRIPTLNIITNDEDQITQAPSRGTHPQRQAKWAPNQINPAVNMHPNQPQEISQPQSEQWNLPPSGHLSPLPVSPLLVPTPHMDYSHLVSPLYPYYSQGRAPPIRGSTAGTLGDIQLPGQEPPNVVPMYGPPLPEGAQGGPLAPQGSFPIGPTQWAPLLHPNIMPEKPNGVAHITAQDHQPPSHIIPPANRHFNERLKTPKLPKHPFQPASLHPARVTKVRPLINIAPNLTPTPPTRSHIEQILGMLGVTMSPDELGTRSSVATHPTRPRRTPATRRPHHGKAPGSPQAVIDRILGEKKPVADKQSPSTLHKPAAKHHGSLNDFFHENFVPTQAPKSATGVLHHAIVKNQQNRLRPLPGKALTGGKKKDVPVKPPGCPVGPILTNVVLANGIKAGKMTKLNEKLDFDTCTRRCCAQPSCNAAMESGTGCFLIACNSQDSCRTEKSTDPIIQTKFRIMKRTNHTTHSPLVAPQGSCLQQKALGMTWGPTAAGTAARRECPREAKGIAKRQCNERGHWFPPDFSACISLDYKTLNDKLRNLGYSTSIKEMSSRLEDITSQTIDNSFLFGGDLIKSVHIMNGISHFATRTGTEKIELKDLKNFVRSASNLLDDTNRLEWDNIKHVTKGPTQLMRALDEFGGFAAAQLRPQEHWIPAVTNNLVMAVAKLAGSPSAKKYTFPDYSNPALRTWTTKRDTIVLPSTLFHRGLVRVSSIHYKTLPNLLPHRWNTTNHVTFTDGFRINSKVIATTLYPRPLQKITPPVTIILHHIKAAFSAKAKCVFWDFQPSSSAGGSWSTEGCWVVLSNSTLTICQCEHLTHFAVLTHLLDDKTSAKEQARENTFAIMWLGIPVTIVVILGAMYTCFAWSKAPRRRHTVFVDKKPRLPDDDVVITNVIKEDYSGSPAKNLFAANQTPSPSDLEWEHAWDVLTNCDFEPTKKEVAKKVIKELDEKRRIRNHELVRETQVKDSLHTSEYFSESESSYLKWKHQDDFEWSRERIKCLSKGMVAIGHTRPQPADSLEECIDASLEDEKGDSTQSFEIFSPDAISSPNAVGDGKRDFGLIKQPDKATINRRLTLLPDDEEMTQCKQGLWAESLHRIKALLERNEVKLGIEAQAMRRSPIRTPDCSSNKGRNMGISKLQAHATPRNNTTGATRDLVPSNTNINRASLATAKLRAIDQRLLKHSQALTRVRRVVQPLMDNRRQPSNLGRKRKHTSNEAQREKISPHTSTKLQNVTTMLQRSNRCNSNRQNTVKAKVTHCDSKTKSAKLIASSCRKSIVSMKSSCHSQLNRSPTKTTSKRKPIQSVSDVTEKSALSQSIAKALATGTSHATIRMSPSRHMHSYIELRQQSQKLELDSSGDLSSDNALISPTKRVRFAQCTVISHVPNPIKTKSVKRQNTAYKRPPLLPQKTRLQSLKHIKSTIDHGVNSRRKPSSSATITKQRRSSERQVLVSEPITTNRSKKITPSKDFITPAVKTPRLIRRQRKSSLGSRPRLKQKTDIRSSAENRVFGTRLQRWKASSKLFMLADDEPKAKRRPMSTILSQPPKKFVRWRL